MKSIDKNMLIRHLEMIMPELISVTKGKQKCWAHDIFTNGHCSANPKMKIRDVPFNV